MDTGHARTDFVIVGGGAGGLILAARLGRRLGRRDGRRRVLLVDRSIQHIWKPTLHEIAAGALDAHQESLAYPMLGRRNHFRFALGDLVGLDAPQRRIQLGEVRDEDGRVLIPERTIVFGELILAVGAGANLFDTPGAAEHAHLLEDADDARAFHRRLTTAFVGAAFSDEKVLRMAIVGAGATGVELAAELIEAHHGFQTALSGDQRFRLAVTVIEAAPRILGGLPGALAAKAERILTRRGVTVMTGASVCAVHADRVTTDQGDVRADLAVWAAGMKASPDQATLGLEVGKLNQFIVDDRLRASAPHIRAFGDCAQAPGPGGKPVPARAQAAAQQAAWLSDELLGRDRGPFVYRDRGSLVSLGDDHGVGSLMGGLAGPDFMLEGLTAKWAYMSLHLNHHRTLLGLRRTALLALSRLFHRRASGRLKLH